MWLHPHIVTLAVHFTGEQEAADALDLLHSLLGVLRVQSLSIYTRQAHRGSAAPRIQPKETLPMTSRGTTPVPFLALRNASPDIASLVARGSTRVLSYCGNVHGYTFGLLSRRQPLTRDLTLCLERRFCNARGGAHVAASFPQINTLTLNFRGKLSTKSTVQHNANYNVDFSIRPKPEIGTKFNTEFYSKYTIEKLNHYVNLCLGIDFHLYFQL
ncbi:hypothetical protein MY11210_009352 [Beauveria gryllotalpidicola]